MASVNFNMTNNSGFGTITNCNSLNSSVASSPTVNSIRRNSFYKLTNVLLLLFLGFGSSVVSFGMDEQDSNPKYGAIPTNTNNIPQTNNTYPPKVNPPQEENKDNNNYESFFIFSTKEHENEKQLHKELNTANKIVDKILTILHYCGTIHIDNCHNEYFHDNKIINNWYIHLIDTFYFNFLPIKRFYGDKNSNASWQNNLYLGFADVWDMGFLFRIVLVWEPSWMKEMLPSMLKDRVQIHIVEFKPLFFILDHFFIGKRHKNDSWFKYRVTTINNKKMVKGDKDFGTYLCENIPLNFLSLEIRIFKYLHFRFSAHHLIFLTINKLRRIIESGNKDKKNEQIQNNNHNEIHAYPEKVTGGSEAAEANNV